MEFHLNNINSTDLFVGSVLIDLSVEVIHNCFEVYLLQLEIGLGEGAAHPVVPTLDELPVFLQLFIVDYVLQAVEDARLIFFNLFWQGKAAEGSESRLYAVAEGHVDEAQEFISVFVDVEVEEVDEHCMDAENASTDANLRGFLLLLNLSFLHGDSLIDQFLDPCGLLELPQQIKSVLPLGLKQIFMHDFLRIDIIFFGRKQVFRGILRFRIIVDICLIDSKASVAAEYFLILVMVDLILRQFVGAHQHLGEVLLLELDFFGFLVHHVSGVEADNVYIVTASLRGHNFIEAVLSEILEVGFDGRDGVDLIEGIEIVFDGADIDHNFWVGLLLPEAVPLYHSPPPPLQLHNLLQPILHLYFLPGSHEDIVPPEFQPLPANFIAPVLHDELALQVVLPADLPEGVEQSLGWEVVVYGEELVPNEEVLLLRQLDVQLGGVVLFLADFGVDLGGDYLVGQQALLLRVVLGGVPEGLFCGFGLGFGESLVVLDGCDEFCIFIGAASIALLRVFLLLPALGGLLVELAGSLAELHLFLALGLPLGQFDVHRREVLLLTPPDRNLLPKVGIGLAGSLVAFLQSGRACFSDLHVCYLNILQKLGFLQLLQTAMTSGDMD